MKAGTSVASFPSPFGTPNTLNYCHTFFLYQLDKAYDTLKDDGRCMYYNRTVYPNGLARNERAK